MIQIIANIKGAVEKVTGVPYEQIICQGRKRERYYARLIFVHFLELKTEIHYKSVAKILNRDPSTVFRYDGLFLNEKKFNPIFRTMVKEVEAELNKVYHSDTECIKTVQ